MRNILLVLAFIGIGVSAAFTFGVFDFQSITEGLRDEFSYEYEYSYDDEYYDDSTDDEVSADPISIADFAEYNYVSENYGESDDYFIKTLEGISFPYKISYSDISWSLSEEDYNVDAEIEITHNYSDLYAMVVAEDIEYDLAEFRDFILDNYLGISSGITVVYEGEVEVNGKFLQEMVTNVPVDGYDFQYHLYYYTGPEGSIQFVVYYEQYLADIYADDVSKLLNTLTFL